MRPHHRSDFTIAIICALTLEGDAVELIFDELYDESIQGYGRQDGDTNAYVTGRIAQHHVVLCYMPSMGRSSAASVASSLRLSFTGVKLALVVGICGGAPFPSQNQEIFLGDVIISDSVIQYDFGRQYPGGFQRKTGVKDTLGRPSQEIMSLLAKVKSRRVRLEMKNEVSDYLSVFRQPELGWHHPTSEDTLHHASFAHKHRIEKTSPDCTCFREDRPDDICKEASEMTCVQLACDERHVIRRKSRADSRGVSIHIGTIASADTVMKSGEDRDRLVHREGVLGFEMEGAGVWDNIPCIVIKGVCDYADSHKNKDWQYYAAATGACTAKSVISRWAPPPREGS
ncbi:Pfs NB-ARC and TPR domain protein [Penicillium brevicompactum]|uniref:Pfs NB-ARC and TPR domain protein n=1 Tax=Penicillium brevicompactum TaxID=5074 RepID=A0A9W9URE5_PENBR|nr:Pfs NB-ARC and TPR domain protein [Penicillium brevicompactum]